MLALGCVRALTIGDLPLPLLVTLVIGVALLAAHALLTSGRRGSLTIPADDAPWRLEGFGRDAFLGHPSRTSYRGSAAIVLALDSAPATPLHRWSPARRRQLIPVDSVSPADFSLLHLHLTLPATSDATPEARS